jgi:Semialdehyde dehydrogenase, NAD binding domain
MTARVPAIVLGGTGYVAGELLRLLAAHPYLDLAAIASDSQPDEPVAQFFRHLQPVLPHLRFVGHDEVVEYVTANPVRRTSVTRRPARTRPSTSTLTARRTASQSSPAPCRNT